MIVDYTMDSPSVSSKALDLALYIRKKRYLLIDTTVILVYYSNKSKLF
ncbi:MAG: hypothetical protein JWM07_908 [Candidatus Saccharibacteria bacterium]|nr:hypothetical protein [Candidatus Saccharibacteria bacterium]